jgi:hypothetical protein
LKKITTLIALFSFIATAITAQNRSSIPLIALKKGDYIRTLLDKNGKDSLRFGITQNDDTFTVQGFNKYQQLVYQSWYSDSLYQYDARQKITEKEYKNYKRSQNNKSFKYLTYGYLNADSSLEYHTNGQVKRISIRSAERFIKTELAFDNKGNLMYSIENQGDIFENIYTIRRDEKGRVRYTSNEIFEAKSRKINSKITDTFYFPNGQIQEITYYKENDRSSLDSQKMYNDKGILVESWVDSLAGQPFKDNIDCLYGLKNKKGDTIVPPKYERIENIGDVNRYFAYTGNTCVLLRKDGSIVPTPAMSDISLTYDNTRPYYNELVNEMPPFSYKIPLQPTDLRYRTPYFSYTIGNKTGIIDRYGNVILPPQYFPNLSLVTNAFSPPDSLNEQMDNTIKYINFNDIGNDNDNGNNETKRTGYYDLKGISIFNPPLNDVTYSDFKDYFIVSDKTDKYGLMTAQNKEILPMQFNRIYPVPFTPLFVTSKLINSNENILNKNELTTDSLNNYALKDDDATYKHGVFNVETGQWIIQPIYNDITPISTSIEAKTLINKDLTYIPTVSYFIVSIDSSRKKGLMNINGNIVLTIDKDKLWTTLDDKIPRLFYYQKREKYSLFNPEKPLYKYPNYTFLKPFYMKIAEQWNGKEIYFIARNDKGKWGVIKGDDAEVMMPFEYDYAALSSHCVGRRDRELIVLVKDGKAVYLYNNYFLSTTSLKVKRKFEKEPTTPQLFDSYKLIDNDDKIFCVKKDNTILVPPQYKRLKQEEKYIVVEDEGRKKYMILIATGEIINYSEINKIRYFKGDNPLVVFKNAVDKTELTDKTWQKNVFIYSRHTGKQLTPNVNYAVATGDNKHPVFFAKHDTPSIANRFISDDFLWSGISEDTLHFEDNDWLMYDSLGNLINKTPFRFPISFKNELGVGMQGDKMGIFKSNGTALIPPQYERIWRDNATGFYYIFAFRGLKSFISVVDSNGKKCLNAAQYDGISLFFGKYALIKSGSKIGVVDTLGNEIISPQDLKMYKGDVLNTLKSGLNDERMATTANYFEHTQNNAYPHFLTSKIMRENDSLNTAVANLLLETAQNEYIMTVRTPQINRVHDELKINDKNIISRNNRSIEHFLFSSINATNAYISFKTEEYYNVFVNYAFKKDHWELLNNPLFFALDKDKTIDLYNLLVKKVLQLKDADIDCGNSDALIEQAKTQFLITEPGINIYLNGKYSTDELTVISLLWSELKGLINDN